MRATLRVKLMQILAYRHAWYQQVMLLSARDLVGTTVRGKRADLKPHSKETVTPQFQGTDSMGRKSRKARPSSREARALDAW